VSARELPSYVDQNFRLRDEDGDTFVLKISNSDEDPGLVDAQVEVLDRLQARPGLLSTPRVVRRRGGEATVREAGHTVWLVTFLPGRTLAEMDAQPDALLTGLGRGLGDLDSRLDGFDHPAARRIYAWDLRNAPGVGAFVDHIRGPEKRDAVRSSLARFETRILPRLDRLPFQVIHNDANDHNLVVVGEGDSARVRGLLDFGDLVWTARACEVAIAATYAMLTAVNPVRAGARVAAGYHEACPLTRGEVGLIADLITARLCVSVTMSAYGRVLNPENKYLSVSETPAWSLLERALATPPSTWTDVFEDACACARPFAAHPSAERAGG
jgi:Ser/Thr protein kinase RdoA (MazF antagonist)